MLQKGPSQNGAKFPNLASHGKQRIFSLSVGLSRKGITFLGLSVLALLTVFSLAYRTSPESVLGLVSDSASASGSLSSDLASKPWMSSGLHRPLRKEPNVRATPTPILKQLPTTSTLPTPALTSTAKSTLPQSTSNPAPSATNPRTTPLPSQKVTRRPDDVSRYVSFSGGFTDGRGLGNQIFCFAAVLYVAQLTGREPAIEMFKKVIQLDQVFDLNVDRFVSLCPCYLVKEFKQLAFDKETDKMVLKSQETTGKTIRVGGFRQSWRYTLGIEHRLRRHLVFKEDIRRFAEEYLEMHVPPDWNRGGFARVAIHIRRGDVLDKRLADYGYTVPNTTYFQKAMSYFTERYHRVQFITFSVDQKWASENIHAEKDQNQSVHVEHTSGHSAGQDLAIMSMCNHVIMSTGTYGWWGGWLANGTTIYYSDWPRNGSGLHQQFNREDFFPPSWIPMTD